MDVLKSEKITEICNILSDSRKMAGSELFKENILLLYDVCLAIKVSFDSLWG